MGSQNVVSPISPANGTEYTVADIFDYVKTYDSSFVPKEASKVVNTVLFLEYKLNKKHIT